ncbi:MAG: hypothetical protein ABEJ08_01510 [Halobacteriaceae archaeon]
MTGDAQADGGDESGAAGASGSGDGDAGAPGPGPLLAALRVRRQALRGFSLAFLFGTAVFVFFVAVPGTYRSPAWYVLLAFVLIVASGLLLTTALVAVRAYRLVRATEPPDADR